MNRISHNLKRLTEEESPWKFILSRALWRTGLCQFFTIKRPGYRLRFYPTALSANLWLNSSSRNEDEDFLSSYLREGEVMVDVGANIGALSLKAASIVGQKGHVYSIEAHPRTYGFLSGNIALNDARNMSAFNIALGDQEGVVTFSDKLTDDQNSVSVEGNGIVVKLNTLDSLKIEGKIALLKIDVEGYELSVLRGSVSTLVQTECVYFESWESHLSKFSQTTTDIIKHLAENGFVTFKRNSDDTASLINDDYKSVDCENLIAVRSSETLTSRGFFITE